MNANRNSPQGKTYSASQYKKRTVSREQAASMRAKTRQQAAVNAASSRQSASYAPRSTRPASGSQRQAQRAPMHAAKPSAPANAQRQKTPPRNGKPVQAQRPSQRNTRAQQGVPRVQRPASPQTGQNGWQKAQTEAAKGAKTIAHGVLFAAGTVTDAATGLGSKAADSLKKGQRARKDQGVVVGEAARHGGSKHFSGATGADVAAAAGSVASSAGAGVASFFKFIVSRKSTAIAALIVLVLVIAGIGDTAANWGRVYQGVKIGTVDVSGMTESQVKEAVAEAYGPHLQSTTAMIFANEEAQSYLNDEIAQAEDAAQAEQISVEEARNQHKLWTVSATSVGAQIPYNDLADQALGVGRSQGGLAARIGTALFGTTLDVTLNFNNELVDSLGTEIDAAVGDERIDANVQVSNGYATPVSGHDGYMVDRDELKSSLSTIFLVDGADANIIANPKSAPSRISEQQAQNTADAINRAIGDGVTFTYQDASWTANAATVGSWVQTSISNESGSWELVPSINQTAAAPAVFAHVTDTTSDDALAVSFAKSDGGDISVSLSGNKQVPAVSEGAQKLQDQLFGKDGKANALGSTKDAPTVELDQTTVPSEMSLEDAEALGVVAPIGTYTTEYSTYAGTENRNANIHLAADLINNSIATAKDGEWSFNDVAGYCNEDRGFKSAGIILDGEYTDSIGGGICQVATTVFNAVYESGLPVITRHNHSLYIASYPQGRDAAVSYPELDLVWGNDSRSDVLLQTSYTDSTVTVTLLSTPLGYTVSSELGQWEAGEKYSTVTKVNESLPSGTSYISTTGVDGSSITVTRTVDDKDGNVVRTDVFSSVYEPKDQVITTGPNTTVNA